MKSEMDANAARAAYLRVEARREFNLNEQWRYPRLVSGWAAELIVMADGRRQVTGLFLPGERIFASPLCRGGGETSLFSITPLEVSTDEPASSDAELVLLRAEIDRHLLQCFRSVVRLGCLTAYEKIANLLLEIAERAGTTTAGTIDFPLTQELLADLLGLSQVHINRTLQQLRRDGLIELQGGRLTILCASRLQVAGHYRSLFVS